LSNATGARGSKAGFHARCQVVPALTPGGAGRRFISMEHPTATAGATAGERGASGASRRHGAIVVRMTVDARTFPGSRAAHLGPIAANPACGRSLGACRAGVIHSGPMHEPGMRGGSHANGKWRQATACAGDEFAATGSSANPERHTAGERRLAKPGTVGCVAKLRGCALRSNAASRLAAAARSATNSAAAGDGRGAGGGAAAGAGSTGGACGTSCAWRGLFCIRKSSARASCLFRYAFWWAAEQNSACCSERSTPIFFPQKAHSIPQYNRLKHGARAAAEHLGCGRRNTLAVGR